MGSEGSTRGEGCGCRIDDGPKARGRPGASWGFDCGRFTRDQSRSSPTPHLPRAASWALGARGLSGCDLARGRARHGLSAVNVHQNANVRAGVRHGVTGTAT